MIGYVVYEENATDIYGYVGHFTSKHKASVYADYMTSCSGVKHFVEQFVFMDECVSDEPVDCVTVTVKLNVEPMLLREMGINFTPTNTVKTTISEPFKTVLTKSHNVSQGATGGQRCIYVSVRTTTDKDIDEFTSTLEEFIISATETAFNSFTNKDSVRIMCDIERKVGEMINSNY